MVRGEFDLCIPFVDPIEVKSIGTEGVKFKLKLVQGVLQIAKLTEKDIRCDKVELGADGKSAAVFWSSQFNGKWQAAHPVRWMNVDGEWYASLQ